MSVLERAARMPAAAVEAVNILLTTDDATIAATPKDVVWTHRKTTLYRYRSANRTHAIPVVLVFALINRPHVFDLRPGSSFVEFLLEEGFDVYLLDWGVPDDEDADTGLEHYVCDALPWAMREVLRAARTRSACSAGASAGRCARCTRRPRAPPARRATWCC
jgi:polyhydroxyalkanoate synthase